ncbi:MAG: hypothetical protein U0X75_16835 [Acidobacteriota bacterium]
MRTIHTLFDEHKKITRTIKPLANGVETVTESDDPQVKALLVEHSWAMKKRLVDSRFVNGIRSLPNCSSTQTKSKWS